MTRASSPRCLIGITFAVFLMMQMTAMFAGILDRAFSTVTNIGAAMWVMDPAVNTASSAIPMPDYLLDAVRSMDGVSYAVPLFIGGAMVKLEDGTFQSVTRRRPGRRKPVRPACHGAGQYPGHLQRQLFLRGRRRRVRETGEPEDRHVLRAQRFPRHHRGHRPGRLERAERRADALYDLQPRDRVHPVDALHHLLHSGAAEERRRRRRDQAAGRQAGLRGLHQGRVQQAHLRLTTPTRRGLAPTS
jgi:hypothetical protein